jgi:hypothetical protein
MSKGWYDPAPLGPPPGIALVDAIANALEPTERDRQRRAAMKFIEENPSHPLVVEYQTVLAKVKAEADGKEK